MLNSAISTRHQREIQLEKIDVRKRRLILAAFLAVALIASCISGSRFTRVTHAAAAPIYTVTDLGTLGGSSAGATGINNIGQVVGSSTLPGDPVNAEGFPISHAFLYSGGSLTDLGTLPGDLFSRASSINASGQVVGVSYSSSSHASSCTAMG